jgi:hypothetical protein
MNHSRACAGRRAFGSLPGPLAATRHRPRLTLSWRERRFSEDAALAFKRSPEQLTPIELDLHFAWRRARIDELEAGATR